MTAMTDFMVARSVLPMSKFLTVADQVANEGVDHEYLTDMAYKAVAKEGYETDPAWNKLVWDAYRALSRAARFYLENGEEPFDYGEISAWESALNEDLFTDGGWVHRIVNVINHYRKPNGARPGVGDIEHRLMVKAIRDRLQPDNYLHGSNKGLKVYHPWITIND